MNLSNIELKLPAWLDPFLANWRQPLDSDETRMRLAVALSAENLKQGSGGPFGAIVVENESGLLLGAGVNLVTSLQQSLAHAEIMALAAAQQARGHWNLGAGKTAQLVTSCEPCAMCFGAVPWSGVSAVVWGAGRSDAEAAGFDEGDKPPDWEASLRRRRIDTRGNVLREEAAAVLERYRHGQGDIYHPERT